MTSTSHPLLGIDHIAMTVADVDATCAFYDGLFGLSVLSDHRKDDRTLIRIVLVGGTVRLSVHQAGNGFGLVAAKPTVGSVDICFRWSGSTEQAIALLASRGVAVVDGPSPRTTADGSPSQSIYFHDPDGNLVELMAADWGAAA